MIMCHVLFRGYTQKMLSLFSISIFRRRCGGSWGNYRCSRLFTTIPAISADPSNKDDSHWWRHLRSAFL